jgi:SAM-dependent methyltransferase
MNPGRVWAAFFDAAMAPLERAGLAGARAEVVSQAHGDVLELGAGSGLNLPYYRSDRVRGLTLTDYENRGDVLKDRADLRRGDLADRVRTATVDAAEIPYPNAHFDTVVATLVFCSVGCQPCGLDEVKRVLKPGGSYLFLEHVRPPNRAAARLFELANPAWGAVAGGCNLTRRTFTAIEQRFLVSWSRGGGRGVFVWGSARKP